MYVIDRDFWRNWCHFRKHFQAKGLSVAHSLYYNIVYIYIYSIYILYNSVYNIVGRSIASIYNLGGIYTRVVYISIDLPTILYILHKI